MTRAFARSTAALATLLLLSCGGGSDSRYTIDLRYCSAASTTSCQPASEAEFPARYRAVFEDQANRLERMITSGRKGVRVSGISCGQVPDAVPINETVNGLVILVSLRDFEGGVLAQSGPCIVGSQSRLPLVAVMRFDDDNIGPFYETGRLGAVVLHEMFHTLGFGTVWEDVRPVENVPDDPVFTGPQALAAAKTFNEAPPSWIAIPVEGGEMAGTSLSHWREATFDTELMTGFVQLGTNPLSAMSIASLEDLGYEVDLSSAEAYQVPVSSPPPELRSLAPADAVSLEGDVILAPPVLVDER